MPVQVFISYSHTDTELRAELEEHLAPLQTEGHVTTWTDRRISPGETWETAIDDALETAEIVLLLVSSSFLASDYRQGVELKRALKRHGAGEARVIPVIVRPCDWHTTPFAELQVLPRDGKPGTTWTNRDEAWLDVVRGIREEVTPDAPAKRPETLEPALAERSIGERKIAPTRLTHAAATLFGRDDELARLDAAWDDPDVHVITLVAWGGVGKTSLVAKWVAERLSRDVRPPEGRRVERMISDN